MGTFHCNNFPPAPAFSFVLGTSWMLSSPQLTSTIFADMKYMNAHLEEDTLAWTST